MSNYSQFSVQCSNNSTVDFAVVNLVFSVTGAVCCLLSSLIVVVLLLNKAYKTVLERLFLYLMLAIVLRELFMAASLEHQWPYRPVLQEKVCKWIGFIWNWTGILVFVFTVGIKIYLFFYVKRVSKGEELPRFLQSVHTREVLEVAYIVITATVTLSYAAIPFSSHSYGIAGAWCWIRAIQENGTTCNVNTPGMLWQIFSGYIFYVSGSVIGLVLVVAVAVMYCRLPVAHSENRLLLKKTICVIITFLVNIVIMMFALITRVTAAMKRSYEYPPAWLAFALTFPASLLLFPTAYLLCFSMGSSKAQITFFFRKCCRRRRVMKSHTIQVATTVQESDRISYPSETYFSVPYTNQFTDVEPLVSMATHHHGYGSQRDNKSTDL